MLYNFKAKVEKRSPGSVVVIDTEVTEDGSVLFSKFFMDLQPCIDGFRAGCCPYLSIDSSFLTGKWNGQLAACNALMDTTGCSLLLLAYFSQRQRSRGHGS